MVFWQTSRFRLSLDRPLVMGIVNATPDSFSDGGRYDPVSHCDTLLSEGADILDIGGESTRPGSHTPSVEEELARVIPAVRHAVTLGVPVSVDTSAPQVIRAVLDLGVDIINDVRALQRPGALDVVASHPTAGVCLMHMRGEPATMQLAPSYGDVVNEVALFLQQRLDAVRQRGVADERIVLDPGIGFGKTHDHNVEIMRRQHELTALGRPLLLGWSRKSTLAKITGRPVDERLVPSVAAALAAVQRGASIVRVHDVAACVDALKIWRAAALDAREQKAQ